MQDNAKAHHPWPVSLQQYVRFAAECLSSVERDDGSGLAVVRVAHRKGKGRRPWSCPW